MKDVYFTITGTNYKYGKDFLERDMVVSLVKEPDNEVDKEAIRVEVAGLGCIGYVANSTHTTLGQSSSAGRIYDKIGETGSGTVLFNLAGGVVCRLNDECILD